MTYSHCSLPPISGIGFKHAFFAAMMEDSSPLGFIEVHAENYMGDGGLNHAQLEKLCETLFLSIHGVGLSIGGETLDSDHLARVKKVIERYQPDSFSEHLAWSSHGGAYLNDLLPLPYNAETLTRVCAHVDQVQSELKRNMLLENPSTYIAYADSDMEETEFIAEIAKRTGCGLLLDVSNVFISSVNHQTSPWEYLERFPLHHVREIHLGGYEETCDDVEDPLIIDTHSTPISEPVWDLYKKIIKRLGPLPTLIEWDNNVPVFDVVRKEAIKADVILRRAQ